MNLNFRQISRCSWAAKLIKPAIIRTSFRLYPMQKNSRVIDGTGCCAFLSNLDLSLVLSSKSDQLLALSCCGVLTLKARSTSLTELVLRYVYFGSHHLASSLTSCAVGHQRGICIVQPREFIRRLRSYYRPDWMVRRLYPRTDVHITQVEQGKHRCHTEPVSSQRRCTQHDYHCCIGAIR